MRSERKMLPIGVENFEKLRRNDMYYIVYFNTRKLNGTGVR